MSDAAALEHEDTETSGSGPGLRVPFDAHNDSHAAHNDSRDTHDDSHDAHDDSRDAHEGSHRAHDKSRSRRSRLTRLLLAKLALDLLFVATLAVYTHAVAFRPFYSGSLDYADSKSVRGWVVDRAEPSAPVEVQLYVDGRFAASALADEPRPDVSDKGFAPDERHGFVFQLGATTPGEHEARVYAVHASRGGARRTLQQIGGALRFKTEQ